MDASSSSTVSHIDNPSVPFPRLGGINGGRDRRAGFREDHEADFLSSILDIDDPFDCYKECTICTGGQPHIEFPQDTPTQMCQHEIEVCTECLGIYISITMARKGWDKVDCPSCPQRLEHSDMKASADAATFERYDQLCLEAYLAQVDHFQYCRQEKCRSGQIVSPEEDVMACVSCRELTCIKCDISWHSGRSCEQVQASQATPEFQASERYIQARCKRCPVCRTPTRKNGGCNHVECYVCKHEYCWECLTAWCDIVDSDAEEGYTHRDVCPESSNDLDAGSDHGLDYDADDAEYDYPPEERDAYPPEERDDYPPEGTGWLSPRGAW